MLMAFLLTAHTKDSSLPAVRDDLQIIFGQVDLWPIENYTSTKQAPELLLSGNRLYLDPFPSRALASDLHTCKMEIMTKV